MNYMLPFGFKIMYLYYRQRIREASMIFKHIFANKNFYYCPVRKQTKPNQDQPTWVRERNYQHIAIVLI